MKLSKYILFGLSVFVVSLIFNWWLKPAQNNVASNVRFSQVITDKVSAQTLPSVEKYIAMSHASKPEPEVCRDARAKLLTQKISDIVRDIADRRTAFDSTCMPFDEIVTTKDLAAALYKSCQREDVISGKSQQECWQALTFFKAGLVNKAFGARDIADANTETLIYLVMAKISQGEYRTPAELQALNEATDRLIEMMPDSPAARKAAVIPRLVADFENMSKGAALNETADVYLGEALKMNPEDVELQEVALLRQLYSPGEKISVGKAVEYAEQKPTSSLAQYFLAGAFENAGHREDAISAARRAQELEPTNSRYRETLQKLVRGEKNAFIIQMGVGFDSL